MLTFTQRGSPRSRQIRTLLDQSEICATVEAGSAGRRRGILVAGLAMSSVAAESNDGAASVETGSSAVPHGEATTVADESVEYVRNAEEVKRHFTSPRRQSPSSAGGPRTRRSTPGTVATTS